MNIEKELEMLNEWWAIRCNFIPHLYEYGGMKFSKYQLPTFQDFKDNYDLFTKGSLKESVRIGSDGMEYIYHAHGKGVSDLIKHRFYGIWHSCKFFPTSNLNGNWIE